MAGGMCCSACLRNKRPLFELPPLSISLPSLIATVLSLLLLSSGGLAQMTRENCSASSPDDCSTGQWYDASSGCCLACTDCNNSVHGQSLRFFASQCNATHDAKCGCSSPTFLDDLTNQCLLNCQRCPGGGCTSPTSGRCICEKPECHFSSDLFCEDERCPQTDEPTSEPTRPRAGPTGSSELPVWGYGLIAMAIVLGIIIFASCFLCLGLFTMHRSHDPESQQGSETSENGLVTRESLASIGTNSTYTSTVYPYLSSHSMLELLKHSNSQLVSPNDRLSSLQSSPVSSRSSPKPGRTVKLTKALDSDKLTAIVL